MDAPRSPSIPTASIPRFSSRVEPRLEAFGLPVPTRQTGGDAQGLVKVVLSR